MKIAFLTTRPEKPSARYRFLQYAPYLRDNGCSLETVRIAGGWRERRALFASLGAFDVVFLQKRTLGVLDWPALRKNARRIVYDFDDAVMFGDSGEKTRRSPLRMARFARTAGGADAVIAGNAYLLEWALKYNPNSFEIPTPVDAARYAQKDYAGGRGRVTLGWIGSASTLRYLEGVRPVLDELNRRHPETELKIVADRFFDCPVMPVVKKEWDCESEAGDLRSMDIGLMPLTDDVWTRGKCGFKLLQYMAAGVSPVASAVGVNSEIIRDGENGFLASTDDEWLEKLSALVEDPSLRERLGREARRTVMERYSLEVNAPLLLDALGRTAGGAP